MGSSPPNFIFVPGSRASFRDCSGSGAQLQAGFPHEGFSICSGFALAFHRFADLLQHLRAYRRAQSRAAFSRAAQRRSFRAETSRVSGTVPYTRTFPSCPDSSTVRSKAQHVLTPGVPLLNRRGGVDILHEFQLRAGHVEGTAAQLRKHAHELVIVHVVAHYGVLLVGGSRGQKR